MTKMDELRRMKIGDKIEHDSGARTMAVLASLVGKELGRKFHTSRNGDGIVVWRLK